jgi:Rrf2 family protein
MKITYKGDYALKTILDLTFHYERKAVRIEEIAQRQDIPKKFLEQILLKLKQGGFVASKRGPGGGYYLTRDPKDISLGEVIRFIEGPIAPIGCVSETTKTNCEFENRCGFNPIFREIRDAISQIVDHYNFEDIKQKTVSLFQKREEPLMYEI